MSMRKSLLFLLILLLGFLAFAFFVKLPNTLKTESALTTKNPPLQVRAPFSGKLSEIFVKDGDTVEPGMQLVRFQTQAKIEDVEKLESWLSNESLNEKSARSLYDLGPLSLEHLHVNFGVFQKELMAYDFENQQGNFKTDETFQKIELKQKELLVEVNEWLDKHVIRASSKGKIYLPTKNKKSQFLRTGEFICSIIPENSDQTVVGKTVEINKSKAGLVKKGAPAKLHLVIEGVPQHVKAVVEEIYAYDNKEVGIQYYAMLSFPEDLKTSTGRTLQFSQDMMISTTIETEKQTLFQKFLE